VALVCHRELVSSQPAGWESLSDLGFKPYFTQGNAFDALLYLSSFSELSATETGPVSSLVLSEDTVRRFSSWITRQGDNFRLIDYSEAMEDFQSKNSSCLIAGPWMAQQLAELDLISYELPQAGEYPASLPSLAVGFALSIRSQNPDLAQRFLKFMATKQAQRDLYLTTGLLPATRSFIGEIQNPLFRALLEKDLPSFAAPNFSDYFVELLALEQLITDSISTERDLDNIYARYLQKLGEN
jgi:ABC-type glycerol-3-phosphate transport system substrate-binding protein